MLYILMGPLFTVYSSSLTGEASEEPNGCVLAAGAAGTS